MLAITYECTDIVKLLLQKGINIFLKLNVDGLQKNMLLLVVFMCKCLH